MRSNTSLPRQTRRLVLRPGVHVLRRGPDMLQVGLDPARALVLPDDDAVRALLSSLSSPASPRDEQAYDEEVLRLLDDAGLVCDCDTLLPLAPDRPGPAAEGPTRTDVAAAAARCGDTVPSLLAARAGSPVQVVACGAPEAARVAATLVELLTRAGARTASADTRARTTTADSRARTATAARPAKATAARPGKARAAVAARLGVLVSVGEPAREELDPWVRAGTPHLVVRLVEGHAVIGPFVRPGDSACLRCVDAHHTDVDPAWPLLVAQHARAASRPREDRLPEPVDSALATLAAAWAAREVVTACEGGRPTTTGATIRLDPLLTALETHSWPVHPDCGCSWS